MSAGVYVCVVPTLCCCFLHTFRESENFRTTRSEANDVVKQTTEGGKGG